MVNEKQVVISILKKNNISYNYYIKEKSKNFPGILAGELLLSILHTESLKEAAELLNVSERTVERSVKTFLDGKTSSAPTITKLLHSVQLHKCKLCNNILELSENNFWKSSVNSNGFQSNCIPCKSTIFKHYYNNNKNKIINNVGKRKLVIIRATPNWANTSMIEDIYRNCPECHHVDHIIPLQGELVSGLHVENNLQYLIAKDNLAKGNKWIVS